MKYRRKTLASMYGISSSQTGNIVNNISWFDSNYQKWINDRYERNRWVK